MSRPWAPEDPAPSSSCICTPTSQANTFLPQYLCYGGSIHLKCPPPYRRPHLTSAVHPRGTDPPNSGPHSPLSRLRAVSVPRPGPIRHHYQLVKVNSAQALHFFTFFNPPGGGGRNSNTGGHTEKNKTDPSCPTWKRCRYFEVFGLKEHFPRIIYLPFVKEAHPAPPPCPQGPQDVQGSTGKSSSWPHGEVAKKGHQGNGGS